MTNKHSIQPLLRVLFKGSAIQDGRILLDDLLIFISNLNLAIERTINVLLTGSSLRVGRPQKEFQLMSALEVVSIGKGSFILGLDLRRGEQERFPSLDMGVQAVEKLMVGMNILKPESPMPAGFDQGVLMALREAGRVLDHGVDEIQISTKRLVPYKKILFQQDTRNTIIESIRRLEQAWVTIEGRLLMVDLKEDVLRCRIHPSSGMPIQCRYLESLVPQVMGNLRNFVQARGEALRDPVTQKIRTLIIYDLEPLEAEISEETAIMPPSVFWEAKEFDELAIEQGIYPVEDIESISGGFPEDADFDSFLQAIRSSRDN